MSMDRRDRKLLVKIICDFDEKLKYAESRNETLQNDCDDLQQIVLRKISEYHELESKYYDLVKYLNAIHEGEPIL
jgi:hypothetical protein